jgi:hypothetical protein
MTSTGPIFVGGTGRSGTTILGQLVGAHTDVFRIVPTEVRFLTDRSGLLDLLAVARAPASRRSLVRRIVVRRRRRRKDLVTPREFISRLRDHWFGWTGPDGDPRGLRLGGLEMETLEALIVAFEGRLRDDPLVACQQFAQELMAALAHDEPRWIETTPGNVGRVKELDELFPGLQMLHVVRDGRDTAASISTMFWGPNDIFGALDWWADRMVRAYTALEGFPSDRVLTIRLEDLVLRNREPTYERIRSFLELPPDDGMRAFFDDRMTPERGHLGRWRQQLPSEADADRFEDRYREHLTAIRERFGPVPPTEDLDPSPATGG